MLGSLHRNEELRKVESPDSCGLFRFFARFLSRLFPVVYYFHVWRLSGPAAVVLLFLSLPPLNAAARLSLFLLLTRFFFVLHSVLGQLSSAQSLFSDFPLSLACSCLLFCRRDISASRPPCFAGFGLFDDFALSLSLIRLFSSHHGAWHSTRIDVAPTQSSYTPRHLLSGLPCLGLRLRIAAVTPVIGPIRSARAPSCRPQATRACCTGCALRAGRDDSDGLGDSVGSAPLALTGSWSFYKRITSEVSITPSRPRELYHERANSLLFIWRADLFQNNRFKPLASRSNSALIEAIVVL